MWRIHTKTEWCQWWCQSLLSKPLSAWVWWPPSTRVDLPPPTIPSLLFHYRRKFHSRSGSAEQAPSTSRFCKNPTSSNTFCCRTLTNPPQSWPVSKGACDRVEACGTKVMGGFESWPVTRLAGLVWLESPGMWKSAGTLLIHICAIGTDLCETWQCWKEKFGECENCRDFPQNVASADVGRRWACQDPCWKIQCFRDILGTIKVRVTFSLHLSFREKLSDV